MPKQHAPTLAESCEGCAKELRQAFPTVDMQVSSAVSPSSFEFIVIIGDSTLKTNKGRSGSRYVRAEEVRNQMIPADANINLLVACCPGAKLPALVEIAHAVASVANITRLVLVWQGNEYEDVGVGAIENYIREKIVPRLATTIMLADATAFVIPAPDSIWVYGEAYAAFAAEAKDHILKVFRNVCEVDISIPYEFEGWHMCRSHISCKHHQDLTRVVAKWA